MCFSINSSKKFQLSKFLEICNPNNQQSIQLVLMKPGFRSGDRSHCTALQSPAAPVQGSLEGYKTDKFED